MADQQTPYPDTDIEAIIGTMQAAGSSLLDIKRVVELHDSLSPRNRVALRTFPVDELTKLAQAHEDEQHPIRASVRGAAVGAAKGVAGAAIAVPKLAYGLASDAVSQYKGEKPEFTESVLQGIHDIPKHFKESVIEGGPAERAEYLANAGAQLATGAGQYKLFKPSVRVLGKGLQAAGEHPFHTRIAGAGGLMGGLIAGNPEVVAAGLGVMAAPSALTAIGRRMQLFAGEHPDVVSGRTARIARKIQNAQESAEVRAATGVAKVAKVTSKTPMPSSTRDIDMGDVPSRPDLMPAGGGMRLGQSSATGIPITGAEPAPYRSAAKAAVKEEAAATTAERIRTEREAAGYTEEQVSHTTREAADGESKVTRHTQPKTEGEEGGGSSEPIYVGGKRLSPAQAVELRQKMARPAVPVAGGPRMMPVGKAAQDLAAGIGERPRPAGGPASTVQDLAERQGTGLGSDALAADEALALENARRATTGDVGGGPSARANVLGPSQKVPVTNLRPNQTHRLDPGSQPSATRGFDVADMAVLGLEPNVVLKNVTPQMLEKVRISRLRRQSGYIETDVAKSDLERKMLDSWDQEE